MIYGSVCSGIEAASVAWHPLGWRASFYSEIDAFPRAVLAHRFPGVPLHGDFTTIEAGQYEPIDLLVGGTPCQSFSVAGLRGGLADERGNLALEYLRLADRLRPRWLVWENVPGVLSSNGGRDFGSILGGMVELGYGIAYRVLDAQYFSLAQRRRRVFVVGHLGDWRRAAAVLFERHSLQGHPAPRREAGKVAPTVPSRRTGGGGLGTDFDCDGGLIAQAFGGNNQSGPIEVATAVNAHGGPHGRLDFESETFIAHSLRAEGFDASEDGTGRSTPLVPVHAFDARQSDVIQYGDMTGPLDTDGHTIGVLAFDTTQITSAANRSNPKAGDPWHPLAAGAHAPAIAFSAKDHGADAGELSPTLRAGGFTGSHANGGVMPAVMQASAVRRLTPVECEKLQGFPPGWTDIPWRGKPNAPDGPRYKSLGNSFAVPVVRWIGERIATVEALTRSEAA